MKGHDMEPSNRATARRDSLQHVRRMSNWTAAVLIAGTGTAAVALAHQASQAAAPPATAAPPAAAAAAGTPAAAGPRVTHSVATTTASGVTVTTTTRTANGKTVVTQGTRAPAGGDN
jgi:hypothetical protein